MTPPGPCHLARKDRERRLWRWRLQRPGPRRKAPPAACRGWRVTCAQGQQRLSDRCQSQQAPPGRAVGGRPELRAPGSGTSRPSWPELGHHWPGREGGKAPGDAEPPQRPLQVPTSWPNSAHMLPGAGTRAPQHARANSLLLREVSGCEAHLDLTARPICCSHCPGVPGSSSSSCPALDRSRNLASMIV